MDDHIMLPDNINAATAQRLYALEVLRRCGGDRAQAAAALNVDPSTLRTWMASLAKLGVEVPHKAKRPKAPSPRIRGAIRIELPPSFAATA